MFEQTIPKMMTRERAAQYTGLSERQLKRREESGRLQRLKPSGLNGGTWYLTQDLDALVEDAIETGAQVGVRPPRSRANRRNER